MRRSEWPRPLPACRQTDTRHRWIRTRQLICEAWCKWCWALVLTADVSIIVLFICAFIVHHTPPSAHLHLTHGNGWASNQALSLKVPVPGASAPAPSWLQDQDGFSGEPRRRPITFIFFHINITNRCLTVSHFHPFSWLRHALLI